MELTVLEQAGNWCQARGFPIDVDQQQMRLFCPKPGVRFLEMFGHTFTQFPAGTRNNIRSIADRRHLKVVLMSSKNQADVASVEKWHQ